MISLIAVLGRNRAKRTHCASALQALLLPTRQEPGNLDYALFQLRDAPDTFYMREAWRDRTPSMPMSRCLFSGVYDADGVSAG